LTLANDLSFALQFSKTDFEQITQLNRYDIPGHIEATDARRLEGLSEEELNDLEYQFRVIYTFDSTSKSKAHMQFVNPESEEGQEIRTVLVKTKIADDDFPHKPSIVSNLVSERSGQRFTTNNHTQAWKLFEVRPNSNSKTPEKTDRRFCIFHKAHGDYTYSEAWVDFLVETISDQKEFEKIKKHK